MYAKTSQGETWRAQWRNIRQLAYFTHHIFYQFSVYRLSTHTQTWMTPTEFHSLYLGCVASCVLCFLFSKLPLSQFMYHRWLAQSTNHCHFFSLCNDSFGESGYIHIGISQKSYEKLFIARSHSVSIWYSQFSIKVECVSAHFWWR